MSPETAAAEPMGPLGIVLIVLAFFVFFPLMWFGITGLLSTIGGWRELGAQYAAGPAVREGRVIGRWVTTPCWANLRTSDALDLSTMVGPVRTG